MRGCPSCGQTLASAAKLLFNWGASDLNHRLSTETTTAFGDKPPAPDLARWHREAVGLSSEVGANEPGHAMSLRGPAMGRSSFFDGERLRKAHSVRQVAPIFQLLAAGLAEVPELRYIKVFPERIATSNVLSQNGKKNPVVVIGAKGLVAVELLIDTATQVVQFYAITSTVKGCGRKIVAAVVTSRPRTGTSPSPSTGAAVSGSGWRRTTRGSWCFEGCRAELCHDPWCPAAPGPWRLGS